MIVSTPTKFAPANLSDIEEIKSDYLLLSESEVLSGIVNAIPNIILILNENRQIVFYNALLLQTLNIMDSDLVLSLRPGELLSCIHSKETEGGCGTTASCRYCGAVMAIMAAQQGNRATNECRINVFSNDYTEALDLKVATSPFPWAGKPYTFFSIVDISSEKRRQALERIFFHDVLNTASSMQSTVDLLMTIDDPQDKQELMSLLPIISRQLISEVKSQNELLKAEKNELLIYPQTISSRQILSEVICEYEYLNVIGTRSIEIDHNAIDMELHTDPTILKRIIGNMFKNAFEASVKNDVIRINMQFDSPDTFIFSVQNPQFIPAEIQLQIFNRSFSTKGEGRGLGTYSIKLLTEKYLKGKVSFTSDQKTGTRFVCEIPITL